MYTKAGPPYDPRRPLEAQPEWAAPSAFMNALEANGPARLAGAAMRYRSYYAPAAKMLGSNSLQPIHGPGLALAADALCTNLDQRE